MKKTKKIVLIILACILIIGITCVALTRAYLKTWEISYGFKLVKNIVLDDPDYYHLKKGRYCGEGGSSCNHWIGYIYYNDDFTAEQAMEKAGYKETGYTWYDGKTHTKYSFDYEDAIIENVSDFSGGHLLEYHIIGVL